MNIGKNVINYFRDVKPENRFCFYSDHVVILIMVIDIIVSLFNIGSPMIYNKYRMFVSLCFLYSLILVPHNRTLGSDIFKYFYIFVVITFCVLYSLPILFIFF
jgi:hypothetical protein